METHSYSFTGLSDIYESFMMDMAGAAEIPATKLFGRSPQGFNSTGESDLRNYYDMIASLQERLYVLLHGAPETSESPEAEAAWFPESKTLVVMNNAETAVRTRVTWPGGSTEMILNPMETRITEG